MEEKILDMIVRITDEEEIKENLDINLFENDILDSLGYTELLVAIEEEFGFEFEDEEMYSISTVEDLKNLIEKKM